MVMLQHRAAAGPTPTTCTTTSSSDARDKETG
jgi:hypothetical protein